MVIGVGANSKVVWTWGGILNTGWGEGEGDGDTTGAGVEDTSTRLGKLSSKAGNIVVLRPRNPEESTLLGVKNSNWLTLVCG